MARQKGVFTVSLDFELYWGMRDKITLNSYKENLLGVRSVVPTLLKLFDKYKIHATWATVGFLFFETRDELVKGLPDKKPMYVNSNLSPYEHINNIGNNEKGDPLHYAPSLIKMILTYPNQEIGSHTFSHYYCLESGQNAETFRCDLEASIKAAKKYNLNLESFAFPRNQVNHQYLSIFRGMKIGAYRGNESSWINEARNGDEETLIRRAVRLLDSYINISGHNCYSMDKISLSYPFCIPASRFLRPYNEKFKAFEPLRLKRVLNDLTYAAKEGLVYHLWWHPHNFGVNLEENAAFLKKILEHYFELQKNYGMESHNMGEISRILIKETGHEK